MNECHKLGECCKPVLKDVKWKSQWHAKDFIVLNTGTLNVPILVIDKNGMRPRNQEALGNVLRAVDTRGGKVAFPVVSIGTEQIDNLWGPSV